MAERRRFSPTATSAAAPVKARILLSFFSFGILPTVLFLCFPFFFGREKRERREEGGVGGDGGFVKEIREGRCATAVIGWGTFRRSLSHL